MESGKKKKILGPKKKKIKYVHVHCSFKPRFIWSYRWTSNQSILKEINPEYSLEGLMLKLKLPYFGHLL